MNTRSGSGGSGRALADASSRWSDLAKRVLSALVLLPVALGCLWVGGIAFTLFVAAGCFILAREWVAMCGHQAGDRAGGDRARVWVPAILVAAALCTGLGSAGGGLLLVAGGAAAALLFGGARRCDLAFGFPYIGLAAVAIVWLRADPVSGWANTLFALVIVWASDIGAYLAGRLIGGPKLAPAISPGKTWSGSVGGLVSAALGGLGVAACLSPGFSPSHGVEPAIGLGILSQAGDLLESGLKRRFGVKDSGRIMPGHGGLLDRIDALLAVAPAAALLAFHVGQGVVLWR